MVSLFPNVTFQPKQNQYPPKHILTTSFLSHSTPYTPRTAIELRDTADSQRDAAVYGVYLSVLLPAVTTLLQEGHPPVSFIKDSPEQVEFSFFPDT
jgi:hypothetical protein